MTRLTRAVIICALITLAWYALLVLSIIWAITISPLFVLLVLVAFVGSVLFTLFTLGGVSVMLLQWEDFV